MWGRRRLAYEIKKNAEGIYAVIQLTAEPDTVKEFDRQLGLNESVLRTKVMRPVGSLSHPGPTCGSTLAPVGASRHDERHATTSAINPHEES